MKIFNMNDVDWFAGKNAEECWDKMKKLGMYGNDEIQDMKDEGYHLELGETEMNRLKFVDDLYDPKDSSTRTFKEQLQKLINEEHKFPCFFASTEY